MVAGSFLTQENVSEAFYLEPPQALRLDLDDQDWCDNSHHLLLAVEDDGLEVFIEKTK
jgi:hypothetical protein